MMSWDGFVHRSKSKCLIKLPPMMVILEPLSEKALMVPIKVMWAGTTGHLRLDSGETSFTFQTKPVGACDVCGSILVSTYIGVLHLLAR